MNSIYKMRIVFLLVSAQFFVIIAFAQIQGDIVDQNNKGVPNATIIATDSLKNKVDTARSDNRGFYSFNGLAPGKYKIQIKAAGFKLVVLPNIVIKEGETGAIVGGDLYNGQRLDIVLSPAKLP